MSEFSTSIFLGVVNLVHKRSKYALERKEALNNSFHDREKKEKINLIDLFFFEQGEVLTTSYFTGSIQ